MWQVPRDASVLQVVAERRVRGAVERAYLLRLAAADIGMDNPAGMSAEDHRQALVAFVAGLLADADRHLHRGTIDSLRDGAGYRMAGRWLDDAEFAGRLADVARVLQPRLANGPRTGRRRILATVLAGDEATEDDAPRDKKKTTP